MLLCDIVVVLIYTHLSIDSVEHVTVAAETMNKRSCEQNFGYVSLFIYEGGLGVNFYDV